MSLVSSTSSLLFLGASAATFSRSADLGFDFSAFLWFCPSRNRQLLLVPRLFCVELVGVAFALALLLDVILFVGTFTPTVFWISVSSVPSSASRGFVVGVLVLLIECGLVVSVLVSLVGDVLELKLVPSVSLVSSAFPGSGA